MEEATDKFPVDVYVKEIEFDAAGIALLTCEKSLEARISVDCSPSEVCSYKYRTISYVQ